MENWRLRVILSIVALCLIVGCKALHKETRHKEETKEARHKEKAQDYCDQADADYLGGNYNQAIKYYTKAIELNPEFANAYYSRGLCYRELKRKEEAIRDFKKFLEFTSEDTLARDAKKFIKELEK